jgi:hypothetical protein
LACSSCDCGRLLAFWQASDQLDMGTGCSLDGQLFMCVKCDRLMCSDMLGRWHYP